MPAGGVVQPDGRPPKAKGIGKTARRHDLEAPATPGVGNSDMQQGDRKRLEQAQKVAPRPKKQNSGGAAQPAPQRQARRAAPKVEVPDAIDFIGGRAKGTLDPKTIGQRTPQPNIESWQPLLRRLARDANIGGPITTTLLTQLSNFANIPSGGSVEIIDQNAAEDAIRLGLE